ncbi:retrotransposon ORF1 [Tanacetum coccineum]
MLLLCVVFTLRTSSIGISAPAKVFLKPFSSPSTKTLSPGPNRSGFVSGQKLPPLVYRELVREFFALFEFDASPCRYDPNHLGVRFRLGGEQKEISLLELGWRIGLYFERKSKESATLSRLRKGVTVKANHLLLRFWPTIGDDGFNVGNTKVAAIRDPRVKLAHRCIAMTIAGRKESTHRVTEIDLFYLYCIYSDELVCNIPYWLAKYMVGVREKSLICGGMFVTRIARSYGLLTNEMIGALKPVEEDEEDDKGDEEAGGDTGYEGARGSADMYHNMSQGRKAHLLEDKQIPSVGVFDEVFLALGWLLEEIHVTWAHLEKKQTRLRTYTKSLEDLCIQSDNAMEFLKGSLGPLIDSPGIEHQTSYYVITATYLINRFPTTVLKFKTPYEVLLSNKPVYEHLRVFGCLAVASNPSRVADKFEARGIPCLFLGYPQHQKGYKLLNLLTHTRFVSRDVIFYEHIFPYSKSSMAQVLQPIPAPISSPVWYEDFVNTDQASPQSNALVFLVHYPTLTSPHETEQAPLNDDLISEPEFEPVLVPNTTLQPEATRKSTRVLVQPSWLKDYVIPHHPKANQVSVTSLQNQYHAFLCALVAQTTLNYFKKTVKDADWKKAKLVINGNRQRKRVDYEETFTLVVNIIGIKSLLNAASIIVAHIRVNAAQLC